MKANKSLTCEIIFPTIRFCVKPIFNRSRSKNSRSNNELFHAALSKNEWVAFIDCRTIPDKNWLKTCAFSAKETGADFVSGLFKCDADTYFQKTLRAATYGYSDIKALTGGLVSKKAFQQSGGFQDVRAGEDID